MIFFDEGKYSIAVQTSSLGANDLHVQARGTFIAGACDTWPDAILAFNQAWQQLSNKRMQSPVRDYIDLIKRQYGNIIYSLVIVGPDSRVAYPKGMLIGDEAWENLLLV